MPERKNVLATVGGQKEVAGNGAWSERSQEDLTEEIALGPSSLAEWKGYYMERGAREDGGGVGRKGRMY